MNEIMRDVNLKIALCLLLTCLSEVSAYLSSAPEVYTRERYENSRKRMADRRPLDPKTDTALTFVALANLYGYPAEEHYVTTADGYKLRFHRIPGSPRFPKQAGKPVVYIQPGIFESSDIWILFGPDKDLAYILADAGYDVWIGNPRGTTYSRFHVKLSPNKDPEFWEFSFHEVAVYDVPAIIDYILQVTGRNSVVYVGHSMGTTISYVLLSTRPEYNEKISLVISLAPVAFWTKGIRPAVKLLKTFVPLIVSFSEGAGLYEFFPLTSLNEKVAKFACDDGTLLQPMCMSVLFLLSGFNPKQMNTSVQSYIYSYFPAGTSRQTLTHYGQFLLTGEFKMYDYGLVKNFAKYRKSAPPHYDLSKATAPFVLVYGKEDVVVEPNNVYELAKKLPNVVRIEEVPDNQFGHMDFLFSINIKSLLNERLLNIINEFSGRGK